MLSNGDGTYKSNLLTPLVGVGKVLHDQTLSERTSDFNPRGIHLRRGHLIAAMLTVTLACAAACTTAAGTSGRADVVVAASLELSGSAADLGTAYRRALELKADQINASGLLAGRKIVLRV